MARGIKESLLIGGGALLVLLTVLLLVSLRDPAEQEEEEAPAPPVAAPAPAQPPGGAGTIAPEPTAPARPAPVVKVASPAPAVVAPPPLQPDQGGPTLSPLPVARELVQVSPAPTVSPLLAPAAEPLELENEPDPRRREMLRRMHKLAVAKMRQGVFTRRARMLEQSMAEGQASGTWSEEKVRGAKADLVQLEQSIKASTTKVEDLKEAVDQEITE